MEQASSSKRKSSWKKKNKSIKKQKKERKLKKDVPRKAEAKEKYFYCDANGHWRKKCPLYLESLKTKKDDKPSEGMLVPYDFFYFKLDIGLWFKCSYIYLNAGSNRK